MSRWGGRYSEFDFRDTFTPGKGSTYQVRRADFDKLLADQAQAQGVQIRYEEEIIQVDFSAAKPRLYVRRLKDGSQYQITMEVYLR